MYGVSVTVLNETKSTVRNFELERYRYVSVRTSEHKSLWLSFPIGKVGVN